MLESAISKLKKGDVLFSNYVAFETMDNPGTAKVLAAPRMSEDGMHTARIKLQYGAKVEMELNRLSCFAWRVTIEPEEVVHVQHRVHRERAAVHQPAPVVRVSRQREVEVKPEPAKPVVSRVRPAAVVARERPVRAAQEPATAESKASKAIARLSRIK